MEALVDTGASRSFILPSVVQRLGLQAIHLEEGAHFRVANGESFAVHSALTGLEFDAGSFRSRNEFLVSYIPYDVILGLDWLSQSEAMLDCGVGKLRIAGSDGLRELTLIRAVRRLWQQTRSSPARMRTQKRG
ncbi:hypothetical protein Emed_006121 [Eimeria media]